jgi:ribosomal-protein-alanine N-acetyltransferase
VILRRAATADLPALTALEATLFGDDAWTGSAVREELEGPGRHALVAVADGTVVGYAVTMRSHDLADLQRIAVHPTHRRHGIARRLLEELVARAAEEGASRLLLEVRAGNAGALGLYAEAGFVEIDRRRRYYRDGSDAIVMRRVLPRPGNAERG